MSTTLCVLAGIGDAENPSRLAACNVGDSRLYALDRDCLGQVTVDHTISENLVRDGVISAAEAATHVDRHTLTRAVGFEPRVHVDGWELAAIGGTRFLLCSDGLTNEVPELEIARDPAVRSRILPSLPAAWWSERCRPGHGRDNVTTVVVDVLGGPELPTGRWRPAGARVPARCPDLIVAMSPGAVVLDGRSCDTRSYSRFKGARYNGLRCQMRA